MDKYYVICQSEDGLSISGSLTQEEVLQRIDEKYYGDLPILDKMPEMNGSSNLEKLGIIIIKGSIKVPGIKQVVTKYQIY